MISDDRTSWNMDMYICYVPLGSKLFGLDSSLFTVAYMQASQVTMTHNITGYPTKLVNIWLGRNRGFVIQEIMTVDALEKFIEEHDLVEDNIPY